MLVLLGSVAAAVQAPEFVCSGCAFATLGQAAASVQPGEARSFEVLAGTYVESQGVLIGPGRSITFTANGGVTVTRGLPALGPLFQVVGTGEQPAALELHGFSLAAISERTLQATFAEITLDDCILSTLGVAEEGGAVFVDRSILRIEHSLFLESTATTHGGHVLARDSSVTVLDTNFRGGFARFGGSIALQSLDLVADTASITGGRFEDNLAAEAGGAISVRGGVALTIDGVHFEHNVSPIGGAVSDAVVGGGVLPLPSVTIERSTFEDNDADESGGAVAITLGDARIVDSTFRENSAGTGGAVYVGGGWLDLRGSLLCGNEAERGGALATFTDQPQTWQNSRLVENEATVAGGAVLHEGGRLTLRQGNFLGNVAPSGGVVLTSGELVVGASLLAHTAPARAVDVTGSAAAIELSRNAWWRNAGGDVEGFGDLLGEDEIQDQDPLLARYMPGLGCDAVNDYYSWYGPLRDAAASAGVDPDGTPADIGAYGGPGAPEAPWIDADGDGFPALYDCLEGDAAFHPDDGSGEPVEVWYDDLDQDCRGDDDHDQDGDGWRRLEDCDDTDARVNPGARDELDLDLDCEPGVDGDGDGYSPPLDCDDTDPDINPGEVEDPDPTVDRDCAGPADVVRALVPAPCSTSPGPAAGGALVLALLAARRRRPVGAGVPPARARGLSSS